MSLPTFLGLGFSAIALLGTLCAALVKHARNHGQINGQLDSAAGRLEAVEEAHETHEERSVKALGKIAEDMSGLRTDMAEVRTHVEWLRQNGS